MAHRIARYMRTKSFWTCGYFYETVGSVTAKAREFYIRRCQDKHWENVEPVVLDNRQAQLTNWFAQKPSGL